MGPVDTRPLHLRNRAQRRAAGYEGHGALAPIDLGIKEYKRKHEGQYQRVLYFKQEMWKSFQELKEKPNGKRTKQEKS